MTHVSILVPHGSVLLNSVISLLKIFDLANRHFAVGGRGRGFELHLVGSASTADLYGGHFTVKPDLTLTEVAATNLAIIPAMAGNIAEAIKNNYAFIPWIQKQYRAGSEIAGLCTGAFLIADTCLTHEEHCSSHWFVDATFRKQYPQITSLAEKTAVAAESIHSDVGAWFFLQKLLERVAGKKAALACSATFQDPFNRECQSVVSISDPRRQHANRIANRERISVGGHSMQEMTVQRVLSRFEVNHGVREGSLSIATVFEESLQTPDGNTNPKASPALSEYEEQGRADNHNTRTFKALFKKIERLETSYGNG
jgi:putative intracellular protease/amidase